MKMATKTTLWFPSLMKRHRLSSSYIIASTPTFVVVFVLHTSYVAGNSGALHTQAVMENQSLRVMAS